MIELFCRSDFELHEMSGITPIHIDDAVSSLSAVLLDDYYHEVLLTGHLKKYPAGTILPGIFYCLHEAHLREV